MLARFVMPARRDSAHIYRRQRLIRRAVTVLLGVVLIGSATSGTVPAQAVSYGYSGLWSGLLSNGGGYASVTAEVTVPRVSTYCGSYSNVAVFIGLGGWQGLPFVQNGFTVTPKGFGVWSEVFDRYGQGPTTGISLPIRSGDRIRLSLSFSWDKSVLYFRWENLTLNRVATQRVPNAARYYNGSTADYVVERSYYPYRGSPLARYSPTTFRNAKAVRWGRWVPAYNPGSTMVTALGSTGNTLSRVTYASGTTFSTGWSGCK
jgi:hypothetical protein